ncbi:hypothetical protein [Methylosinus sporium]|uniref:hypothetical protein n=1 Tax=Methylosinus sporium TaxID=428 RepID=UPI00383B32EE
MIYTNPDSFFGQPRFWSPERSRAAWEQCYLQLSEAVTERAIERLYTVFGLQGAGKSHWIRTSSKRIVREPAAVFDAALPAARHRARAIEIAGGGNIPVYAIWLDTKLTCQTGPLRIGVKGHAGSLMGIHRNAKRLPHIRLSGAAERPHARRTDGGTVDCHA